MSRLAGAITVVREAIVIHSDYALAQIKPDDDLIDDLALDELEVEGLLLTIEELFGVHVPDDLFATPLYRTPESFAEWLIRQSEQASWAERRRA